MKKLIGTLVTVVFLIVYCFAVMLLAVRLLPGTSGWVQLAYYVFTGLIWVVPIAALIKWMQTPPARAERRPRS
ncbi:DUF2842 domain-containing protein [Acuticoccus sp. MNP-M23]|uniref:DUF2842 domain-containing protein n=1 Tax=Acuticoccus sp. MNP-M23 TaxID=3072793 RepID=UPI0028157380|nr:DUF2842 domain-containing protein [Acuticoccus sp. MNP-M23]WMS43337.1 DUF2842 domain-containing protein [Acuticoccus sp. MNP-M23]